MAKKETKEEVQELMPFKNTRRTAKKGFNFINQPSTTSANANYKIKVQVIEM